MGEIMSNLINKIITIAVAGLVCAAPGFAETTPAASKAAAATSAGLSIGIVNFKTCVEQSKYGKQEQSNFEALKKQMETVLEEKEKSLNEISAKFNDPDYLDSLSQDAEKELKHKFRTMNQEMGQIQSQYYQALNQANMKILQKLNELVAKASQKVAQESKINMILNDDGGFYFSPDLDISKKIVVALDDMFEAEQKEGKNPSVKK